MLKAVIFDVDGVLIDTVALGLRTRQKILATHFGIDLATVPDPQHQGHRIASMKTLLASIEQYTGKYIDLEAFSQLEHQAMREDLPQFITADPGLRAFLQDLKTHGITCAVTTTGQREGTDIKLNVLGIRDYFSVVTTGNDVRNHKPHPEAYLHTLERLGLPAEDCVIFEDSLPGVQAGLAAGCRVIGFSQYNPPKEPLPGVAATVERWSDISYDKLVRILATAR